MLGHEWSGTIAAVGSDVEGWSVGARVVCGPQPGCGKCRACVRGRSSVCLRRPPVDHLSFRGAFCRYVVPSSTAARVPDELPSRAAALTEPTAVAMHAVNLSGVTPGDRVLVTGGGPVGLLATAVLHAQASTTSPSPSRRPPAASARSQVGAAHVVTPDELPTPSMGRPVAEPYTVAFECSGNAAGGRVRLRSARLRRGPRVRRDRPRHPRINHNRAIVLENTIIAAYNYDIEGFAAALELLASGRDAARRARSRPKTSSSTSVLAMHRVAGELPGKVMVRPRRSGAI